MQRLSEVVYPAAEARVQGHATAARAGQNARLQQVQERLKVNQRVYLWDHEPMPKLGDPWKGPFVVVELLEGGSYRLANLQGELLPRAVPMRLLKVAGELEKVVASRVAAKILGARELRGELMLLTRWAAFPKMGDSWVKDSVFPDKLMLEAFQLKTGFGRQAGLNARMRGADGHG